MTTTANGEINVFCCYAPEDQALYKKFDNHLSSLKRRYPLKIWSRENIDPGEERDRAIIHHASTADLFFLLISSDFMSSSDCMKVMQRAQSMRKKNGARINAVDIAQITDSHYHTGNIGAIVGQPDNQSVTEAAYTYARVWTK